MKSNEFDFREYWNLLSEDPYPQKKLCRHVVKEISYSRATYNYFFGMLSVYVVVDNLLDTTKEDDHLSRLEKEISVLLRIASAMWDSYSTHRYSLRCRRKLESLIKRLERDLDAVVFLLDSIAGDVDMLNTIMVGEDYINPSEIALIPGSTPTYYRWQKN